MLELSYQSFCHALRVEPIFPVFSAFLPICMVSWIIVNPVYNEMGFSTVARILLLVVLGTCCFFDLRESAKKYLAKDTTTVINYEQRQGLKPPRLIFCPSNTYRPEVYLLKVESVKSRSVKRRSVK